MFCFIQQVNFKVQNLGYQESQVGKTLSEYFYATERCDEQKKLRITKFHLRPSFFSVSWWLKYNRIMERDISWLP